MEHIACTSATIENAKRIESQLYITFLDLTNAFCSISHQQIRDMLNLIQLPTAIV